MADSRSHDHIGPISCVWKGGTTAENDSSYKKEEVEAVGVTMVVYRKKVEQSISQTNT